MADPFDELEPVAGPEEEGFDPGPPAEGGSDPDLLLACAALPLNDVGNGARLVRHFGVDLLHVPRVGWHVWDGKRWKWDGDRIATRALAQRIGPLILEELPHVALEPGLAARLVKARAAADRLARLPEDAPEAEALRREAASAGALEKMLAGRRREARSHARSSGNTGRIDSLLTEAEIALAAELEALDADPLIVNTAAATIRFRVSRPGDGAGPVAEMATHPHARGDRLTKIMPVAWDPAARAPRFEAFLAEVQPDPAMRAFLARWLGLSMTGLKYQALAFFHGSGANGKSVLVDLMARLMGDYAATAKIESLVGKNRRSAAEATPDLVPLIGARFVRASEPEEGERLQEAKIKELTGGEPIQVRALNKDFVEVRPIFKLTISGNHKPEIRGTDDGIWRRVLLIPWEVTIPEGRRDPKLVDRLMEEAPGIFNWLVDGLLDFLEGGLRPPEAVLAATEEYRRDSDPLGRFLAEAVVLTGDPSEVIRAADLERQFAFWLLEQGASPWRPTTVTRQLSARAGVWRHPGTGQVLKKGKASVSQYVGLRLADAFRRRWEDAPKDQGGRALVSRSGAAPGE